MRWKKSMPFSPEFVRAIRDVAKIKNLPCEPKDERDWLNPGPWFLFQMGLPEGFESRLDALDFGALRIHMLGRQDLITLKLWAAISSARGKRRVVDINDLRTLQPSDKELDNAIDWCVQKDGTPDVREMDIDPVLRKIRA